MPFFLTEWRDNTQKRWECKHYALRLAYAIVVAITVFLLVYLIAHLTTVYDTNREHGMYSMFGVSAVLFMGGIGLITLG